MTSLQPSTPSVNPGVVPITTSVRLQELESVIERGLKTFVEVGEALREINENRLYREMGHGTFEEYCKQRWGWERRQAYNYIAATEVLENVHSNAQNQPSLTQAVELSRLSPEQQREVAAKVDFSTATVKDVKLQVQEIKRPGTLGAAIAVLPPGLTGQVNGATHRSIGRKELQTLVVALGRNYERHHERLDSIRFIRDDNGKIKTVEIVSVEAAR